MKKTILFLALILLLTLAGSFYFLRNKLMDNGSGYIPFLTTKYNFDYTDGEKPWATHIETNINTTFETALNENDYLRSLKCAGDSTDTGKIPFGPVKPICLQGNGAKMIVPNLGNTVSYAIFNSPMSGGVFEQEHMAKGGPFHFFDIDNKSRYGTKYFVVPFNGYEVPTYSPIEAKIYLPIWKQAFQKFNSVDDNYFNSHIFVVGASAEKFNFNSKEEKRFSVTYYYQVDWARVRLNDSFTYSLEGVGAGMTLDELMHDIGVPPYQSKFQRILNINKIKPATHIATKEQIKNAVKTGSSLLRFDVNKHMVLGRDGELVIRLYGTVDDAANKCLSGTVVLENAQVLEVRDSPCRIY